MIIYSNLLREIQYKRNRRPSQEEKNILPKLSLSQQETLDYCIKLKKESPTRFRILDSIIYYWGRCSKEIYFAQRTIAKYVGVTREYVNRAMEEFERLGLFKNFYRQHKTSLYSFPAIFADREFNYQLGKIFKSLLFTIDFLRVSHIPLKQAYRAPNPLQITQYISSINSECVREADSADFHQIPVSFLNQQPVDSTLTSQLLKKENDLEIKPPSTVIMELRCLNLTKAGQITLSVFPDEAIKSAAAGMKHAKNLRDPFRFFYKLCQDYCKANEIFVDRSHVFNTLRSFGLNPDSPMLSSKNSGVASQAKPQREYTQRPLGKPPYKQTWNEYSRSCRICPNTTQHDHSDKEIKTYYLASYRKHFGDLPQSLDEFMGGRLKNLEDLSEID